MIKQVNQNMQGQSESAVQIDQAMVHLNEVSVSTKKAISEFNNENKKLNEVAGSMDRQLQRFKL